MRASIVGEDNVTQEIIRRLITLYAPCWDTLHPLPARGSQATQKDKIEAYNKLAHTIPVILLTDLDAAQCAPRKREEILSPIAHKQPKFLINVAVEEAETWLMADKENFISYFGVQDKIPEATLCRMFGRNERREILFRYKPSLYMMKEIIPTSNKPAVIAQLHPKNGAKKGPEYNTAMLPFISQVWNPENARKRSYSLNRMIVRIQNIPK